MSDVLIESLRGGLNEDPPISLRGDQCVIALNVDFVDSKLGERRRGSIAIDVSGSALASCDRVIWKYEHYPTTDPADVQLWALGITDGTPDVATLAYKDTSWHTVAMPDPPTIDGSSEYQMQGQSLHGKLFLAYKSAVDRLHVWDGTQLRRVGLAEPNPPTAVDQGSGSVVGDRSYRVRFTTQVGGITVRRSEPSESLSHSPSSAGSVQVTRPALLGEGETHWELEVSLDETNYYVLATVAVGTTTFDDGTDSTTNLADLYELSEDIGDYTLIPSVKYLSADEDRLMGAGAWENADDASSVLWTPVHTADGIGNDERLESDTDPTLGLDNYDGGAITGLSANVSGYVFAFKQLHVYQLTRTKIRTRAYNAIPLTKQRGAIPGSVVEAFDPYGQPIAFALDPDIGPIRIGGEHGVEPCGRDLIRTWETVNLDATVVARGLYFPEKLQIHWWIATGTSEFPNTRIVLHTNLMRWADTDGWRGGWAIWDGPSASVYSAVMFPANIDDDAARSRYRVPFIGVEGDGLIWRTDTGDDDNGEAYHASLRSRPIVAGNLLHQFEAQDGALLALANDDARIDLSIIVTSEDGVTTKTVPGIDLTPGEHETDRVIRGLDGLGIAEANYLQFQIDDVESPQARWQLELIGLKQSGGQRR